MAKIKPSKQKPKSSKSPLSRVHHSPSKAQSPESPTTLLQKATTALQTGDIEGAIPFAKRALAILSANESEEEQLPALNLLGEIHVELGEIDAAREYFWKAADLDEDGEVDEDSGGGAEKFLWLAQLCEEGGEESVGWFEKGANVLRTQIQKSLDSNKAATKTLGAQALMILLEEKRRKLAMALCGIAEVYMTDLSWEEDAEQKCELLVTEATMVAPEVAEPWQTLANVRLSQSRLDDARAALKRSLDLWKDLPPEDGTVPDFPTRVSLARLLMEAELEEEAIEVLERLVSEDDTSVEVWYLGGWGLYIMGEKQRSASGNNETYKVSWISSRQWLNHSMRLFMQQEYEDIRLGEHAKELIAILNKDLGGPADDGDEEDEWEEEDGEDEDGEDEDEDEDEDDQDEDEEMADS